MSNAPKIEKVDVAPLHSAIVDASCLAMVMDGEVHDLEFEHLTRFIMGLLEVGSDIAVLLIEDSLKRIDETPLETFISSFATRAPNASDRHKLLFAVMLTGYTDGAIVLEEEGLVFAIADFFGMNSEELDALIDEAEQFFNRVASSDEDELN